MTVFSKHNAHRKRLSELIEHSANLLSRSEELLREIKNKDEQAGPDKPGDSGFCREPPAEAIRWHPRSGRDCEGERVFVER